MNELMEIWPEAWLIPQASRLAEEDRETERMIYTIWATVHRNTGELAKGSIC